MKNDKYLRVSVPLCEISFPVIVKPNAEGSSKGIPDACVAKDEAELEALVGETGRHYHDDLLVEQYIKGREFTVGILGNGSGVRVFEPMEIVFNKLRGGYRVYSFEVKRNFRDYVSYQCPPVISNDLKIEMMRQTRLAYETLGCRDFSRVDFRLSEEGRLYFLEINPLPGLAPDYSDLVIMARFNGMDYKTLVCEVLHHALKRCKLE